MPPSTLAGNMNSRLSEVIRHETVTLRDFLDILRKEQVALIAGDLDALSPYASEKSRLAEQLSAIEDNRNQIVRDAGSSGHPANMYQWLERQGPDFDEIRAQWDQLLFLAKEARTLNESNGSLIAMRLQHNQKALAILLSATRQASLYGPDGQTHLQGGNRLFGAV